MASYTQQTTAVTGNTITAAVWNNEFSAVATALNSISNAQIASDAAISASKISGTAVTLTGSETLTNKTLTAPTLTTATLTTQFAASGEYDNGNSGSSKTITWTNGDRQLVTITASTTLAYAGAIQGQILTLRIVENGTGGYSITLPTSKWPGGGAGTFTTTANAINVLTVLYDGTNYLTQLSAGFA